MFLWSPQRDAFLMYGIQGHSWVTMGDPVGPEDRTEELLWSFRELCDRAGGRPVFYEVGTRNLPLYLELGLTPLKIGEAGRVPLDGFSLQGGLRSRLRTAHNRVLRDGCTFNVLSPAEVPALLPSLRRVSDAWLADKNTREKGFSLGFFREDYLVRFPCATVSRDERLVAFATLLPSATRDEISVDLMRFTPQAPQGTMDYLFSEILLWAAAEKYRWFALGMAPLSGLEDRSLAPLWNRIGAYLFRHGEYFYNFQGLRAYKDKFAPVWEPRYLVTRGGPGVPRALLDVATLISGSLRGVVSK